MLNTKEIDIILNDESFFTLTTAEQQAIFNAIIKDWAETNYKVAIKNGVKKKSASGYLNTPELIYGDEEYVYGRYMQLCRANGLNPTPYTNWAGRFEHDLPNYTFLISTESEKMSLLTWYLYHELTHYHIHQWLVLKNISKPVTCSNVNMSDIFNERLFTKALYSKELSNYTTEENVANDTTFSKMITLVKNSSLSEDKKREKILYFTSLYKKTSQPPTKEFVKKKQELLNSRLNNIESGFKNLNNNLSSIIPDFKQLKTITKIKVANPKKIEKLANKLLQQKNPSL